MTQPPPSVTRPGSPGLFTRFVSSLRFKVVGTLLASALLPLLLISLLHYRFTSRTIQENMKHTLQAAASEAALSLNAFASAKLTAIGTEAKLPMLANFLLTGETRSGNEVFNILRSINRQDPIFISSSALLNLRGRNVIDTAGTHVGRDESAEPYFLNAIETGLPTISSVRFEPGTNRPYIALSAPVITPDRRIVGVLRTFYSAQVLQQIVVGTGALAGPRSFAILLDENNLILAYGGASPQHAFQLLYNLATPLPPDTEALLRRENRLPNRPVAVVDNPFVRAAAGITQPSDQDTVAAVTVALSDLPGNLSFVIPSEIYLEPLHTHTNHTLLLVGGISLAVIILSAWSTRVLFEPLRQLKRMTRRVAAGNLSAKVPVLSRDELGELAEAFNRMTRQLSEREIERDGLLASEQAARSEAEQANRLKDDFLATLSHELRTPLAAIIGWINLLKNKPREEDLREGLEVIERNAWAETQLVEDLLDVSRIARGKITLNCSVLDLCAVVQEALDTVAPSAQEAKVRLESDLPADGACTLGDWNRLRQVVLNLLNNAIKFTPEGGSVRIQLKEKGDRLRLTISDTGIGIPPEYLAKIFSRFMQVDSSSTRRFGGMGLGLAIAWHLVELHGGTIEARSDGINKGATFEVDLPAEMPSSALTAPSTETSDQLNGCRILLIEDDGDTLQMLCLLLEDAGAEVTMARSAAAALAAFEKERPEVIVSDIGLPDEDGYTLLNHLRTQRGEGSSLPPAIALTAYGQPADHDKSREAGFALHLTKPVDPTRLVAGIAGLVQIGPPSAQ